jgi:hypothetical protein
MEFHADLNSLVLFAGLLWDTSLPADSYQLVGNEWNLLPGSANPHGRMGAKLAYDADQEKMWMFGGTYEETESPYTRRYPNDVWMLDATGWHEILPDSTPSTEVPWGRTNGSTIWHPRIGTVVFGGDNYFAIEEVGILEAPELLSQWLWTGSDWHELAIISSDDAYYRHRHRHAVAYDAANEVIVQFGGQGLTGTVTDNTFAISVVE